MTGAKRKILILFLAILGTLSTTIVTVTGQQEFYLANIILPSPMMQAFSHMYRYSVNPIEENKIEFYLYKSMLILNYSDNSKEEIELTSQLYSKIRGPHLYTISFGLMFSSALMLGEDKAKKFADPMFCRKHHGFFRDAIPLNNKTVVGYELIAVSRKPDISSVKLVSTCQ